MTEEHQREPHPPRRRHLQIQPDDRRIARLLTAGLGVSTPSCLQRRGRIRLVTARFQFEASSRWRAFKSAVIVSIVEKKGQRITEEQTCSGSAPVMSQKFVIKES